MSSHQRVSVMWRMFSASHWVSSSASSAQYQRAGVCRPVRLMCMCPPDSVLSVSVAMRSTSRRISVSWLMVMGSLWYSREPSWWRLPSGHQPAMSLWFLSMSVSWLPSTSISSPKVNGSRTGRPSYGSR